MVCSYRCFYCCSIYYNLYYNTAIKAVKSRVIEENKNKIKPAFKPYFYCVSAVLQYLSRIFGKEEVGGSNPLGSSRKRHLLSAGAFFNEINSGEFVKCTACVKYGCAM